MSTDLSTNLLKMNLEEKLKQIIKASGELKPGLIHLVIEHDDDCPALRSHCLADCTCKMKFQKVAGEA